MKAPWGFLLRSAKRPMSCDEVAKLLQHYLDDVLDDRRAVRLAAHLDDCRNCGLEAETYLQIKQSLAARRVAVPAESLDRLRTFAAQLAEGHEQHPH